jgi:hypothetical protein
MKVNLPVVLVPTTEQRDLFKCVPEPPSHPLIGLEVRLPDACPKCGAVIALVGTGKGPHQAVLHCRGCSFHRGWVSHTSFDFLNTVVCKFGRPTAPILIRRGNYDETASSSDGGLEVAPLRP